MKNGIIVDHYDFLCGNDPRIVKIALNNVDYHTIQIQAKFAQTIDFSGGVKNLDEIIINHCLQFNNIVWPENAGNIKRLKIGNCIALTTLDLSRLTSLEELNIVDCNQLCEINGLSEQLRFINIQGCQLDTLNLRKSKKMESLILSTSSSRLHLPLSRHDCLRVAIINMADAIKTEKMNNISQLECDFTDCTLLDTLHIKSFHIPAVINITGCDHLTKGVFSIKQSEIIGHSTCLKLNKEEKSIHHTDTIEKFRLHTKKHAVKMPKNSDDLETVVQENGMLRKNAKACIVKINLLLGPKLHDYTYQNNLYKLLNIKHKVDASLRKKLPLINENPHLAKHITGPELDYPITGKYKQFLTMKKSLDRIATSEMPQHATPPSQAPTQVPQILPPGSPKKPLKKPLQLELLEQHLKKKIPHKMKPIIRKPIRFRKSMISPVVPHPPAKHPITVKPSYTTGSMPKEPNINDDAVQLQKSPNISQNTTVPISADKKNGTGKALVEYPSLVHDKPEEQYLAALNISENKRTNLLNRHILSTNLSELSSTLAVNHPTSRSDLFNNCFLKVLENLNELFTLTNDNLSADKISSAGKTSFAGKTLEEYPSLIHDKPEDQYLAALNISKDKKIKLLCRHILSTNLSELSSTLAVNHPTSRPDLFNSCFLKVLENLNGLLTVTNDYLTADKINNTSKALEEYPSLVHDQSEEQYLAALNISENMIDLVSAGKTTGNNSKALEKYPSLVHDKPTEQYLAALNISKDKKTRLLSRTIFSANLSALSSNLEVKHSYYKSDQLNTSFVKALKNFNALFNLTDDSCNNSGKNDTGDFSKNNNTALKDTYSKNNFMTLFPTPSLKYTIQLQTAETFVSSPDNSESVLNENISYAD